MGQNTIDTTQYSILWIMRVSCFSNKFIKIYKTTCTKFSYTAEATVHFNLVELKVKNSVLFWLATWICEIFRTPWSVIDQMWIDFPEVASALIVKPTHGINTFLKQNIYRYTVHTLMVMKYCTSEVMYNMWQSQTQRFTRKQMFYWLDWPYLIFRIRLQSNTSNEFKDFSSLFHSVCDSSYNNIVC